MPQYHAMHPARAKPALPRQPQSDPGDNWPHERRADPGDNLRERDNATLLAKPEQQRTQGDQQTEQRQNGTFVFGGVGDEPRRQRGQKSCQTSGGHQQTDVIRRPVPLRQEDTEKRTETVTDVSDKKTRQAQRPQ